MDKENVAADKMLQIVKYGVVIVVSVTFFALLVVWATKGFTESPVVMIIVGIVAIVLIVTMIIDTTLKGVKNSRRTNLERDRLKYRHEEKMAQIKGECK